MTTRSIAQSTRHHLATFSAVGSLLLSSAVLVACGGGGGVAGGGTGATVTGLSVGTVSGKGSTIVNGVEFDDSSATVLGEDDSTEVNDASGAKHKLVGDDVKLGMEVEIEHGTVTCPTAGLDVAHCDVTPVATATKVSFGNNSLVAPITNFAPAAPGATPPTFASFTLLGQQVQLTASTEVNLESLVLSLAEGVVVEVHGSFNQTTGVTTATRVEVKAASSTSLPTGLFYRLRGTLNVAAKTIGTTSVDLTGLSAADTAAMATLDGKVVRAKLDPATTPPKVLSLKGTQRKLDDHKGGEAEFEGVIDTVGATTNGVLSLTVNGTAVSVDTKTLSAAGLVVGAKVEVQGKVDSTGTLVATKITLHNEANDALVEKEFLGYTIKPNPNGDGSFVNTYDATAHTFEVWSTTAPFVLRETVVIVQPGQLGATVFKGKGGASASEADIARQGALVGGKQNFDLFDIHGVRGADGKLKATTIQIQPKKGV